ncbi:flavodoxin domain-containing protein [Thalassotalea sp. Y01]|uniref:flavodoxin domain-containing protein n=1 Tax=Thalassotalea sp. Y01 TaxID=2729613 RepID=UPI00145E4D6D|nr:flavodoxin domain-containing protein [Thalassotalea sp. Y01]NMP17833.1 FMN-binding protein MioC [Thalassotalea sp. Y01]
MASFQIIVGSMLGNTEYIAEAAQTVLEELGHQTNIHFQPIFEQIEKKNQKWLLCTSTHGAGDFPENIENFIHDLNGSDINFDDLPFLVIAVGDTSYDTFCQAGKSLYNMMLNKNAKAINEIFTIDMINIDDPELAADQFMRSISDQL